MQGPTQVVEQDPHVDAGESDGDGERQEECREGPGRGDRGASTWGCIDPWNQILAADSRTPELEDHGRSQERYRRQQPSDSGHRNDLACLLQRTSHCFMVSFSSHPVNASLIDSYDREG
jgi:hypothetical protein